MCVCACVCLHFFGPGFYELYVCATRWPCKCSAEWGCQSGNFRNVLEAFAALFFLTLSSLPLFLALPLSHSLFCPLGSGLSFGLTWCSFSGCAVPFYVRVTLALAFVYIGDLHVCVLHATLYVWLCVRVCMSLPQLRFKLHIKFMRMRLLCTCVCVCASLSAFLG